MTEKWISISGYEGLYDVSNYGNVKSLNYRGTGKSCLLKTVKDKDGYLIVALHKNGKEKKCRVHRLVAEAFISNPDNLPVINHKDENKLNNCVENLEYCTHSYNLKYSGISEKGTNAVKQKQAWKKAVESIKKPVLQYSKSGELIAEYESISDAGRQTEINYGNISKCCLNRKNYKSAGGFIWRFK